MIALSSGATVTGGAVIALLIVGACWALFVGLRARSAAASTIAEGERLQAMLAASPALAMIVAPDGRVEMPQRLADWFGLPAPPRFLADLVVTDAGLSADDGARLIADVAAAHKAGRRFRQAVSPQGSSRSLVLQGDRAPPGVGELGTVVVWVFDATDSEAKLTEIAADRDRVARAFEALTGLIEAAPLPMWYRDADLRLAMVNSAYVRAVEGKDGAEVIARGAELVEGTGIGGPLANAAIARDTQAPQMMAMPATIDGARRRLRVYDVPLPVGGVAGFAIDIEELEEARNASQRFAAAQRAMLDRLSEGVAQFGPDRALVFCNQPFRRLFAMRGEWLAETPEFDRVLERMREANRVPETRDFPAWKAERRGWFTAASGEIEESWHLPGGRHLRVVAQPLPDGGLLAIFEDRTEEVQLASARDTLLRVRTATFDNLFEALGVFSADGRLQLWNSRFRTVWGFDEDFLGTHPRVDVLGEAIGAKLTNPARATAIGEMVRAATVDRQQRGGRVTFADGRHFEFAAVPLPDGNALFTMLDVSDSRKIEQALRDRNDALEDADRTKTTFVANMSYELRTPLTSIAGFAEMLHGGYAGKLSRTGDDYVEAIIDSTDRLGSLIDDVLDLTRAESGGLELAFEDVDISRIAYAAAETMRPKAKSRGVDFAIEVLPSAGRVRGDASRLQQAIEHLLRHALSDTDKGGRVLLHADGGAAQARIVVSDDGVGMAEEEVARAFDRFARSGVAPSGERALGLGLPLARQFVEGHGGSIELVSEPGEGTLITIALPRR